MASGGFPEPRTWSHRIRRVLARPRRRLRHHPRQPVPRLRPARRGQGRLAAADDAAPPDHRRPRPRPVATPRVRSSRLTLRRWYQFLGMQKRVARQLPRLVTVSTIVQARHHRADGRDRRQARRRRPSASTTNASAACRTSRRCKGRLMTTASADVPLKGLMPLLEAVAKVKTERDVTLTLVGKPRSGSKVAPRVDRARPAGHRAVQHRHQRRPHGRAVQRGRSRRRAVAVRRVLVAGGRGDGVSTALVATTGGALPEVVGTDGTTGILVPPNDPGALAAAIIRVLDDKKLRESLERNGRKRVETMFTWKACAEGTVREYEEVLTCSPLTTTGSALSPATTCSTWAAAPAVTPTRRRAAARRSSRSTPTTSRSRPPPACCSRCEEAATSRRRLSAPPPSATR